MEKNKKIPLNKAGRVGAMSASAVKLAAKHGVYLASRPFSSKERRSKIQSEHYQQVAKSIFETVASLKGAALKALQMVSSEADLLPPEFRTVFAKACYQVPPLNRALVRKVIMSQLEKPPETLFERFETEAFAAASIGQVHRADTIEGAAVVVKIQYPGIAVTIAHDLSLLRMLLGPLLKPILKDKQKILHTILEECETRFIEETDYVKERSSMNWFRKANHHPDIVIPRAWPSLSSGSVLTMDYLQGMHLEEWLQTDPSQSDRDHYGQLMWDFFMTFFTQHHILHADPNIGNFLFLKEGKLGVLDFGCIKSVSSEFPANILSLIQSHINHDIASVLRLYRQFGIIGDAMTDTPAHIDSKLAGFRAWLTEPYRHERFDFGAHPDYMKQRLEANFRTAGDVLINTTPDFVMFDRTYMGLMNTLSRMRSRVVMGGYL